MNTTTYIRYSEPTVRNNISQAYSQCLPEPDYGYPQQPNYGYSPEPQNASFTATTPPSHSSRSRFRCRSHHLRPAARASCSSRAWRSSAPQRSAACC